MVVLNFKEGRVLLSSVLKGGVLLSTREVFDEGGREDLRSGY